MMKNNNKTINLIFWIFNFRVHNILAASSTRHFSSAAIKFNKSAPAVSYSNSDTQKLVVYKENKNKCGVYM